MINSDRDTNELFLKKALTKIYDILDLKSESYLGVESSKDGKSKSNNLFFNTYSEMSRWLVPAVALLFNAEAFKNSTAIDEASLMKVNKRINMSTHLREVDNILVYIFLKSLLTMPKSTRAYSLGLINDKGKLIREPATPEEEDCISNLDLLCYTLRSWIRPYIGVLSKVAWLRNSDSSYRIQNAFGGYQTLSKRAIVLRANKELSRILLGSSK